MVPPRIATAPLRNSSANSLRAPCAALTRLGIPCPWEFRRLSVFVHCVLGRRLTKLNTPRSRRSLLRIRSTRRSKEDTMSERKAILFFTAAFAAMIGTAYGAHHLTGEQVVQAQCITCHETGLNGAPRIGDREAWVPRL